MGGSSWTRTEVYCEKIDRAPFRALGADGGRGSRMHGQQVVCGAGETVWVCTAPPARTLTYCYNACAVKVCASDETSALAAGIPAAKTACSLPVTPSDTQCFDQHTTSYYPGTRAPPIMSQTNPSCLVTDGDDACVVCAMNACCADYNACAADMNCSCLVGCLYQGNSISTCTTDCGAPDSVSVSTAACLNASCPSQCANPGAWAAPCARTWARAAAEGAAPRVRRARPGQGSRASATGTALPASATRRR
jgi:hypothetical protein